MANLREISDQVLNLLADEISLDVFEDWSAEYSWNLHRRAGKNVQDLAYQIRGILNAHADDETEQLLRQELAAAIFPFLQAETQLADPSSSLLFAQQSNIEMNEVMPVG